LAEQLGAKQTDPKGVAKKEPKVLKFRFTHSRPKYKPVFARDFFPPFLKDVIGKCQISTSMGAMVLPSPLPTPMNMGHYLWGVQKGQSVLTSCTASSAI